MMGKYFTLVRFAAEDSRLCSAVRARIGASGGALSSHGPSYHGGRVATVVRGQKGQNSTP